MKHSLFYAVIFSFLLSGAWSDVQAAGEKPAAPEAANHSAARQDITPEAAAESGPLGADLTVENSGDDAADAAMGDEGNTKVTDRKKKDAALPGKKTEAKKQDGKAELKTEEKSTAKTESKTEVAPGAKNQKDYVVLRIDGDEIKNSELEEAFKIMVPGGDAVVEQALSNEAIRQSILREIISKKLVYKEALKEGLDKTDTFAQRLELARRQLLIQAYVEKRTAGLVTDAALKKAYDERVKKLSGVEEIKARHILVSKKEDADKVLKELKAGGDFAKIAREKSEDKSSGAAGGELGWFTQDKMVPEFGKAVSELKKGEFSAPVRTEFGYHIIQVEDRRKMPVPPFEELQHELEEEVVNHELDKIVSGLTEKADIEYYDANGRPKKFDRQHKKDTK